jgi:glycosyltransferase involved in cell wall biosynthesis
MRGSFRLGSASRGSARARWEFDRLTRILRIFSRLNIGGPSLHVIHLSAGLRDAGFETTLVVGRTGEREGDFLDLAASRGVEPLFVPELGREIRPVWDLVALVRLYRMMRREKPEIVHTHTAKAGALGRVAAKLAGVPIVVHTYHGHVLSGYFHPATSAFFRWVERILAHSTTALLTVSDSVRDDLVRLGVAKAEQVRVLPLGLDLAPLSQSFSRGALRREAGWSDDAPIVGIVGRLVPIKDIDNFIDAAVIVAREWPQTRFAVVGDGEERLRLETRAKERLGERIHFFGWRKDTGGVLRDLDVAVNTSLNEGTPVALIEALAAGVPVVATSVGGTPDVLEGGRFGWMVPPRAPGETANAILDALAHRTVALERACAGKAAVLERYSVRRLLDDVTALYRELLRKATR